MLVEYDLIDPWRPPLPISMKVDLISLCDAAVEVNGRLHVLGTIDYFWAAALPYLHPKCALAIRLRWDGPESRKKHRIRIQLVDSDGYSIASEFDRKMAAPGGDHD